MVRSIRQTLRRARAVWRINQTAAGRRSRLAAARDYVDRLNSLQRDRLRRNREFIQNGFFGGASRYRQMTAYNLPMHVMQAAGTLTRGLRNALIQRRMRRRMARQFLDLGTRLPRDITGRIVQYVP